MTNKKLYRILVVLAALALLTSTLVSADDGPMFRKNISKTPDLETEKAAIFMMDFYVPAQAANGESTTIEYYLADGQLYDTRAYAKPLVAAYIDGVEEDFGEQPAGEVSILGGVTFGERDAFIAVSLDDGATWKNWDLSRSAHLSSFNLANGYPYPGDVHNMVHAVAGDYIMAAWLSKYCDGGTPLYTYTDDAKIALATTYGWDTVELPLYLRDLFGVAGTQGSVDYTLQGHPEVGEIPYSCIWSARGQLIYDADLGTTDVVWMKAERLTSGRRDANLVAIDGAPGAGFVMIWQEDPEGLRPGQGLGPGEGWSGAIANQKTDMWYSYIDWGAFDDVLDADGTTVVDMALYTGETMPKPYLPMHMPLRITDNNMCKADVLPDNPGYQAYCYEDFDEDGEADVCAESVSWTNPGGTTLTLCKTADGRVLTGRTAATRTRFNLKPYDTDGDGVNDSAWVVMAYEETKALGDTGDDEIDPIDIGKNIWYHSFDMFTPDIVSQGGMLNQPALVPFTEEFFEKQIDVWGNEFYETEISRRFALTTSSVATAMASESQTSAILIFKQGILNQGGPADIMLRRLVLPENFDPTVDNPYAFENMVCDEWEYEDGLNPNYLKGICLSPAINISGTTIVSCDNGTSGETCAQAFPWDGGVSPFPKVTEWVQTEENLVEQTWANPYDVAKGHRGFIDGDIVMMMYAWSPNWKANSVGNDHYNLYVRRSFDGGVTWTTTPASLGGDGTETCENYCVSMPSDECVSTCTTYGPGDFEQARNVSQLIGNRITILDPRYTPTGGLKMLPITDKLGLSEELPYEDDAIRDPSKFFVVYETGDNTTVAVGEAVPLDLYYSRAYNYGDDYFLVEYPTGDGPGTDTYWGFDWLENKQDDLSGEASNTCNPGGTYYYVVWNQWQEDEHENISNSDIIFRRVFFLPDDDAEMLFYAQILYASHIQVKNLADSITFVGSVRGREPTAFRWRSDVDGELSIEKSFTIPATTLTLGVHTITFSAQDTHGVWSNEASMTLIVGHRLYLPTTRQ